MAILDTEENIGGTKEQSGRGPPGGGNRDVGKGAGQK